MSDKKAEKKFEVIECECGHICPVEFAKLTSDDVWICPNCYIDIINENVVNDTETSKNSLNISVVMPCFSHRDIITNNKHCARVLYDKIIYEDKKDTEITREVKVLYLHNSEIDIIDGDGWRLK